MPESSQWTRAIVLSPANAENGSGISAPIAQMFSARDWYPVEQHDAYLAFAELALRERAQSSRAGWGLQRLEQLALVILEPQHWPQLEILIRTVKKYIASATVWVVQEDELIEVTDLPKREPSQQTSVNDARGHVEPQSKQRAIPAPPEHEAAPTERVSRQEIDMLLEPQQQSDAGDCTQGVLR